jgi:hypothetical protein
MLGARPSVPESAFDFNHFHRERTASRSPIRRRLHGGDRRGAAAAKLIRFPPNFAKV